MNAPLVSALIPNYNHGRFLKRCFSVLLAQTHTEFEVIVTDDGSTDNSRELIEEYARRDARIKPVYFPQNRGMKAAFQNMAERATGKYLYGGAADDFIVNPAFFRDAVAALESDPRPAGFYGMCGVYQSETEKLIGGMGTAEVAGYNTPLHCCQGFLRCRSVVTSPSVVWRRGLYMQHGGNELDRLLARFGPQMDFYLNHALAFQHGMFFQKELYACQRVFQSKTNYSANMHLWETARRFSEVEGALRELQVPYPNIESDWLRWRAYWMMDTVQKSGVLAAPK